MHHRLLLLRVCGPRLRADLCVRLCGPSGRRPPCVRACAGRSRTRDDTDIRDLPGCGPRPTSSPWGRPAHAPSRALWSVPSACSTRAYTCSEPDLQPEPSTYPSAANTAAGPGLPSERHPPTGTAASAASAPQGDPAPRRPSAACTSRQRREAESDDPTWKPTADDEVTTDSDDAPITRRRHQRTVEDTGSDDVPQNIAYLEFPYDFTPSVRTLMLLRRGLQSVAPQYSVINSMER